MIDRQSLTRYAGAPYGATQWILTWEPIEVYANSSWGEPIKIYTKFKEKDIKP